MKNGIVLIGMAGCGKSTLGPLLAGSLDFEFVDLDECIRQEQGCTIQEMIDRRGEGGLLSLEEKNLSSIDPSGKVIAPGGSVIYLSETMERLREKCTLVFLDENFDNIAARLHDPQGRGIIGLKTKSLREIFEERRPLYLKHADIVIKTSGKSRECVVTEIVTEYLRITGP